VDVKLASTPGMARGFERLAQAQKHLDEASAHISSAERAA
jgi:hypothetical protein